MEPQDGFLELLRLVAPIMKERGFSKTGPHFRIRRGDNWGIVNFQKSRHSTAEKVQFTVNVGTVSGLLRSLFPASWYKDKPVVEDGHWRERIGYLLPDRRDKWWTIDSKTSLEKLADEFRGHLSKTVIPAIEAHLSDEALRDLWLSGKLGGRTNHERLAYLAVILKILGPQELVEPIAKQMEREPYSDVLDRARELLPTLTAQG